MKYFLLFFSYVTLLFGIYFLDIFAIVNPILVIVLLGGAIVGTFLVKRSNIKIVALPWQRERSRAVSIVLVYLIYLVFGVAIGLSRLIMLNDSCSQQYDTFKGYITHYFDRGAIVTGVATRGSSRCYSKLLLYCTDKSCPGKYTYIVADIKKQFAEKHSSFSQLLFVGNITKENMPEFFDFEYFIMFHAQKMKEGAVNKLSLVAPSNIAKLYVSILVGGADISGQDKADLKDAGLLHLAAISGANISIVISLVEDIIKRFSRKIREISTILFVGGFVAFVGFQAPVLRAGFTSLVRIVFLRFGYYVDERDMFWIANILLVIVFPEFIWSLSYYLTFTAVFTLLYIVPLVHSLVDKLISKQQKKNRYIVFLKVLLTGIIVQTCINTVLFIMFHEIGWKGYFMTILTEPFFEVFMIIGYLTFPILIVIPKEFIVIFVPILQFLTIVITSIGLV